jgi:hypothetical protein
MFLYEGIITLQEMSLIPKLTNTTEMSPSWESANCAASQELSNILWNPKFHYRVHKSPPQGPCHEPDYPVHTIPSCLSLRSILILSTHLRLCLPTGLFPSGFTTVSYMHSYSPHSCYMPCPIHPPWLDRPSVCVPRLMSEIKFRPHTEPQAKLYFCIFYFLCF